ncbi:MULTISPECIES: MFS transporter [unclassified Micromonospora]|uniref:MFS transporter n=1 Tax=unclassified Micromonospora TaxID=2617518 RepID=UPI003A8565DF
MLTLRKYASVLGGLVPPPGLPRSLAAQSLMFALGAGTFMAGSTVFFTKVIGLSPVQIGLGIGLASAASSLGSLPFGVLIDRIGAKRAWVIGSLTEALLFALYPFVPGFAAFLALVVAMAVMQTISGMSVQVYSIAALPEGERVRGQAYQRSALNVGLTAGGAIAGLALAVDTVLAYQLMVFAIAALLGLAAVFIARLPQLPAAHAPVDRRRWFTVLREPSILSTSGLVGALQAHQTILLVVLPLWVINHTDAPLPLVAGLFAVNTVLVVLFQVKASTGAETAAGSAQALRQSGLLIALACVVFAAAALTDDLVTIAALVVGAVALTAGELRHAAGSWGATSALAPEHRRGEYVGTFKLGSQLQNMVSPAGFTTLALATGGWGWLVIAACFVVAGVLVVPTVAWAQRVMACAATSEETRQQQPVAVQA